MSSLLTNPRLQEGKVLPDDPRRPHGGRGSVHEDGGVADGVRPSAECDVVDPRALVEQLDVAVMLGLGKSKLCLTFFKQQVWVKRNNQRLFKKINLKGGFSVGTNIWASLARVPVVAARPPFLPAVLPLHHPPVTLNLLG